jgi:hypothetical protein
VIISLLAILDAPFRGETAVSPDAIVTEIAKLNALAIEHEPKVKD